MKSYSIQWSKANISNLSSERYTHLFAFEKEGKILFVGSAIGRNFQSHIPNVADVMRVTGANLWLGRVVRSVSSKLNKEMVEKVKNMICFSEKPNFNGKENFSLEVEEQISIRNYGNPAMTEFIRFENDRLYRSHAKPSTWALRIHAAV